MGTPPEKIEPFFRPPKKNPKKRDFFGFFHFFWKKIEIFFIFLGICCLLPPRIFEFHPITYENFAFATTISARTKKNFPVFVHHTLCGALPTQCSYGLNKKFSSTSQPSDLLRSWRHRKIFSQCISHESFVLFNSEFLELFTHMAASTIPRGQVLWFSQKKIMNEGLHNRNSPRRRENVLNFIFLYACTY